MAKSVPSGFSSDEVVEAAIALGVSMALGNGYTSERIRAQL